MRTDRSVLTLILAAAACGCASRKRSDWSAYDARAEEAPMRAAAAGEGETDPPDRPAKLTVEEAVAEALTRNRTVIQSRLAAAIGGTFEREARAGLLPALGARGSYTRVDDPPRALAPELGQSFTVGPREVFGIRFDLNFPIYGFGRHLNRYRAAVLERRRTEADRDTAEADIAAAVTAAAFDLLEGIRAVSVAQSNEAALERTVEDSRALLEAGTVTRAALLEAEVEYDRARRQRERLESAIRILRMTLNQILGRPADAPLEIVDAPVRRPPVWDEEALADEAWTLRPELRAARLDLAAKERSLRAAIGAELPELRGNVSWESDNSPFTNPSDRTTFLLSLDIPIFTGGARSARIQRARHEVEVSRLQLRDLETGIRTELARAYREVVESYADIAVAERSIERSEEALRIQREKFQNGRATSREVLESTATLTDARFSAVTSVYDYNIALRNLHRARGADPRTSPFDDVAAPAESGPAAEED